MSYQFGVDYYPEHWPRDRWETDVQLMLDMGVDVVRLAEFSWYLLEPEKGCFSFGWLDDAIDLLGRSGIKCILGTPTAAPPAWVIEETPEIQPIDRQGRIRHFGGRHHDCQSNPVYREHIRRYVTAFARHYADNEHVIGWQIDNELGNSHGDLCFCPSCEKRFQSWLEEKYGTIDILNEKWGTAFWSQGYQRFSQIQAPKITVTGENPSQMLDWKRFCSDLIVEFHQFQADILRSAAPGKFITHNMMGFADKVNYFDLAKDLEFASHDQYPRGHWTNRQLNAHGDAAGLDLIRGVKQQSFWIMEQQSGITGWETLGYAPRPGELGLWALQSVAHGADTVVFFRWRTCTVGTEQYWHGILPHSGKPGRYYNELNAFIKQVRPVMKAVKGALPKAQVGIVFSYDQAYAMSIQPHHPNLRYVDYIMAYYKALFDQNIPVDFISDQADLSGYSLVIAPLQYLMTPVLESKYRAYVEQGGHLVLTMRTGVKDDSNICMSEKPLPGGLGDVLGLEVLEYDCLVDTNVEIAWGEARYTGEKWCDIVAPTTAEALASYNTEFYAGTPAVTRNGYGKGSAYYVATEPSPGLALRLVSEWVSAASLTSMGQTPEGVEITRRVAGDTEYIFVLNHTEQEQYVDIPDSWTSYYAEQAMPLSPYSFAIYTRRFHETH